MSVALILSGVLGAILTALGYRDIRKWLARRRRGDLA